MIFGLRLKPSITKFEVRMTDLLQTVFFHLIYGKINPKNIGKIIKNFKNNFFLIRKRFFRNFFKGPNDLGQDHALLK